MNGEINASCVDIASTVWSGRQEYFTVKLKNKAGVAKRVRTPHAGPFKARAALAALREDKTIMQLCQEFDLHANQITDWKQQLLERAAGVFGSADLLPVKQQAGLPRIS